MAEGRIYLVRHGRPASTWGGAEDDPGLDELGRVQAQAACDRLLALPPAERPRRVVSSPLRRCLETAAPTAAALQAEVVVEPRVGEIPTPRDLAAETRPVWLRRALAGTWRQIQGDLDYDAWRADLVAAIAGLGPAAVFTHFVAINAVVSQLLGDARVLNFHPDHASVTVLETDGRALTLLSRGAEAATSVL